MSGCQELLKEYLEKIGEQHRVLPSGLTSEVPRGSSGADRAPRRSPDPSPLRAKTQPIRRASMPPLRRAARLSGRADIPTQ